MWKTEKNENKQTATVPPVLFYSPSQDTDNAHERGRGQSTRRFRSLQKADGSSGICEERVGIWN
jgi:hypothetical protein